MDPRRAVVACPRVARFPLALLLIGGLLAPTADAHGGQYKGPAADSGSGGGASAGSGPVTNPGGASSWASGSGAAGAAATGNSPPAGGRASSPRGAPVPQFTAGSDGAQGWEFWWEHNKDEFLDFRARNGATEPPGSVSGLTGRGKREHASVRASADDVHAEIIPVLRRLLGTEDDRDILDSSVLALARITVAGTSQADDVADALMPRIAHRELSVRSATVLALGVLGSPRQTALLSGLLRDDSTGRAATGGGSVDWLVRAFAALSLGLINDPDGARHLMAAIDESPAADRDLKICAVVGLGLMDNGARPQIVAYLQARLADRKLDATVRSFIPTSLGKLGDPAALPALLAALLDASNEHAVRESAAIGLGLLGHVGDAPVLKALMEAARHDGDAQTRHFSTMSLARIGARDDAADSHLDAHAMLRKHFEGQLADPASPSDRAWARLAAALYARDQEAAKPAVVALLGAAYARERDPSLKGASAVALGLLGYELLAPTLLADLVESHDDDLRGYLGVALGLMGHEPARGALRTLCLDTTVSPTLRLQAVTGLGLLRDPGAVDLLLQALKTAPTLGVSSAVARAVGLIGGQGTIAPLAGLATDDKVADLARAFACVALGLVGEKTDLPWNARISADTNYSATVPSIQEVLDIL